MAAVQAAPFRPRAHGDGGSSPIAARRGPFIHKNLTGRCARSLKTLRQERSGAEYLLSPQVNPFSEEHFRGDCQ